MANAGAPDPRIGLDAGIRAYIGPRVAKRVWPGYYSRKTIDHFTGSTVPVVDSASRQEDELIEDHYDLVRHLRGEATEIGDKGLLRERVFRHVRAQRPQAAPSRSKDAPASDVETEASN